MTAATDSVMELIFIAFLFIFDAFETLLSGLKIGIFKELPDKKTNTELNKMLKRDLIELVQIYQS